MNGLDGAGLTTIFRHGHELCHVPLHQLMDHGRVLFGRVMIHAIVHLLLDMIHPFTPCSADDDGSHAGDHRGQCGRVKYGGYPSILLPACAQHGQSAQHGVLVFVVLQIVVKHYDPKIRTGSDDALSHVTAQYSPGCRMLQSCQCLLLGIRQSIFRPPRHFCRSPNIPQYLREHVGVFSDRLRFLFAVKWLVVVRRTVLPSIDTMQCMAPDNLHATDLERTADQ